MKIDMSGQVVKDIIAMASEIAALKLYCEQLEARIAELEEDKRQQRWLDMGPDL